MNFLAHYVLATRFLTPEIPLPAYVVGTALPDLLPLAAGRMRLRSTLVERAPTPADSDAALRAGVLVHLATDSAFHKTQAFAEAQAEAGAILDRAAFEGIRVRRFFVAHVLVELALDAVLLRAEPSLADGFYLAFAGADFAAVTNWTEAAVGSSLPQLPDVLGRFAWSRYLLSYQEDAGVAEGLSRLCARARQDTFTGGNFEQLTAVVGRTVKMLESHTQGLLGETAPALLPTGRIIFPRRQETARAAAKTGSIMAANTPTEKKFRIHYPLEQISAPVLTHLVTDFDLSPNVLRADVSARDGGWLVLGLTGDDATLQTALSWLHGQGLEVSEEA